MISELRFTKSYNSVWRSLAPTMEMFVRKANLRLYDRQWAEMSSLSAPGERALVNRVAFQCVCDAVKSSASSEERHAYLSDQANYVAAERMLIGKPVLPVLALNEASALAKRMVVNLFTKGRGGITLSPRYDGCGIINACFGDAMSGHRDIIELKDGDRPFRSYEFRQVSIYGALYLNSTGLLPTTFIVINSRRGISVEMPIDRFAEEVAGQSGFDYLREIIRVISDETISR